MVYNFRRYNIKIRNAPRHQEITTEIRNIIIGLRSNTCHIKLAFWWRNMEQIGCICNIQFYSVLSISYLCIEPGPGNGPLAGIYQPCIVKFLQDLPQ